MQDNGFSELILHALLVRPYPNTDSVFYIMPDIFDALCLNQRGLQAFTAKKPFDTVFKIFTSAKYLQELKINRLETIGQAMASLGSSIEIFLRHHNTLRNNVMQVFISVLTEIGRLGSDPTYICSKISYLIEDDFEDHTLNLNKSQIQIPLHHYIHLAVRIYFIYYLFILF